MRKYQIMYIIRPNLTAEENAAVIAEVNGIFEKNDSKVTEVKEWGLKELAYEIDHNNKGYYVLAEAEATPVAVAEFNRIVGYNEQIIRHICIRQN